MLANLRPGKTPNLDSIFDQRTGDRQGSILGVGRGGDFDHFHGIRLHFVRRRARKSPKKPISLRRQVSTP